MESSTNSQKGFYLTASVAAVLFAFLIVLDVTASILAGQSTVSGSLSSVDVFNLFQISPFRG